MCYESHRGCPDTELHHFRDVWQGALRLDGKGHPKDSPCRFPNCIAAFQEPSFIYWRSEIYGAYAIKKAAVQRLRFFILAGAGGIEPPRNGVKVRCLTTWLYPQNCKKKWGEWWGSNPRITEPQSAVLASSPHPPHQVSYKVFSYDEHYVITSPYICQIFIKTKRAMQNEELWYWCLIVETFGRCFARRRKGSCSSFRLAQSALPRLYAIKLELRRCHPHWKTSFKYASHPLPSGRDFLKSHCRTYLPAP